MHYTREEVRKEIEGNRIIEEKRGGRSPGVKERRFQNIGWSLSPFCFISCGLDLGLGN